MFSRIIFLIVAIAFTGCVKSFLEPKSDKKMVVPSTLKDLQALLNNTSVMNSKMSHMGEVSADDYYITDDSWNNMSRSALFEKDGYVWSSNLFIGLENVRDWTNRYSQIFYCNTVLDGLMNLKDEQNSASYKNIKGSALFFRAYSFFQLSQLFCAPYVAGADNNELGIPLPVVADINYQSSRSSVKETYDQIINDLETAVSLLDIQASHVTQPNKVAALLLLARTNLVMQNYEEALEYSTHAISIGKASLLDFNEIPPAKFAMSRYNQEVICHSIFLEGSILSDSRLLVDTLLYASYDDRDLRKTMWFNNDSYGIKFKGSYDASSKLFSGFTISELYLTEAECLVRLNRKDEALARLNSLLVTRYVKGGFIPLTNTNDDLISEILRERRKELIFRGVRWSDLRRLNLVPETNKSLFRNLNGITYELKPNSLNYVLPIPDDAIILGKLEQNPRE